MRREVGSWTGSINCSDIGRIIAAIRFLPKFYMNYLVEAFLDVVKATVELAFTFNPEQIFGHYHSYCIVDL